MTGLAPAASLTAHHDQALPEHRPVLGGQFVPIPRAGIGDEAAHLGVVFRAVRHEGQLVGGVEAYQRTGSRGTASRSRTASPVFVQHLGPTVVGQDPLDKVLAQRQVVEPALLLEWEEREAGSWLNVCRTFSLAEAACGFCTTSRGNMPVPFR